MSNIRTRIGLLGAILSSLAACDPVTEDGAPELSPEASRTSRAVADELVVVAQTAGRVRRGQPIQLRLSGPARTGGPSLSGVEFEPELPGQWRWLSPALLRFEPESPPRPGQHYRATLPGLLLGTPEDQVIEFEVVQQAFSVGPPRWRVGDGVERFVELEVSTRDEAAPGAVERMLAGPQKARWTHPTPFRHVVEVGPFEASGAAQSFELLFDGAAIGVDAQETVTVRLSSNQAFEALGATASGPRSAVRLRFTTPLAPDQRFARHIHIPGAHSPLSFDLNGAQLRIFSPHAWPPKLEVRLSPRLKARDGRRFSKSEVVKVVQSRALPSVSFAGRGTIIPTTTDGHVPVPIEVTNLAAVRVEALRVPQENLGQFLQVNALAGQGEMRRVGVPVWKARVVLPSSPRDQVTRHGLDLRPLLSRHPPGLYRLRLSFQPADINYDCPAGALPEVTEEWDDERERSFWDAWEASVGPQDLFRNRFDPCHPGFYRQGWRKKAGRNVLVSDLGLIVHKGANSVAVTVAGLQDALPIEGAQVELWSFQHQSLATGRTGTDGRVSFSIQPHWSGAPFMVTARHRNDLAVMRLEADSSLSTSHFAVGGVKAGQGTKAFLFGERGIWRPGDDVHLTLMFGHRGSPLPANHPIQLNFYDPRGQRLASQSTTTAVAGFARFTVKTASEAPTGMYRAVAQVGGQSVDLNVPIETIVPNRLRINLEFDGDDERLMGMNAPVSATLYSNWLHGAPALGLRTDVEAALRPAPTRFDGYTDFVFDTPTRDVRTEPKKIFEGLLRENDAEGGGASAFGQVQVEGQVDVPSLPSGFLKARLTTRVYEPSGQASVEYRDVLHSPYRRYIGIKLPKGDATRGMLLTDTDHAAELVAVDVDGEPVDAKVELRLYKVEWRWWWAKGREDLARYTSDKSLEPLARGLVDIVNGKGAWPFRIDYPQWGRYLIVARDLDGGHEAGRTLYIDWPGWAGRARAENDGGAAVLSVSADKAKAEVGDTVELSFPMSPGSRALVSLESGQNVLQARWVEGEGTVKVPLALTPQMAPNVYARVLLLQPYGRSNDRPLRLHGIAPIEVVDPSTVLTPRIESPAEVEAESKLAVTVSESEGRPFRYVLMMVEEGLLGLTRHQTPDPWRAMYAKEALGVTAWDLYGDVAGAYAGVLESVLAIGGSDDEAGADGPVSKQRFDPVVAVLGPFELGPGASKTHEIELPPYLGELRLMVVAGHDRAFGRAERPVRVRKDLMLLSTVPRMLSPGDTLQVPVTVFHGGEAADVAVQMSFEGETSQKTVSFVAPGETTVTFPLVVPEKVGSLELVFDARSPRAHHRLVLPVTARMPNLRTHDVRSRELQPGEQWAVSTRDIGVPGTSVARLELSSHPPLGLERRLDELLRYPHGCAEQTTSRAFPQLSLHKLMRLDPDEEARARSHVSTAISKLVGFQTGSGGFSYWSGGTKVEDWVTSWVGHFLVEARRAGFVVPEDSVRRWVEYQDRRAEDGERNAPQAYRLYTLALAGAPNLPAMNRLREHGTLDEATATYLAAAYAQLPGNEDAVAQLLTVERKTRRSPDDGSATVLRDEALRLDARLAAQASGEKVQELARSITRRLSADRRLNPHETALALLALGKWMTQHPAESPARIEWGDENLELDTPLIRLGLPEGVDRRVLVNRSERPLYARLDISAVPKRTAQPAVAKGLEVAVTYRTESGPWSTDEPLDVARDVTVEVSVRNTTNRQLQHVALTHLLPTGFELRNDRLQGGRMGDADHVDLRDDRAHIYFSLDQGKTKRFRIRMHAATVGRFYLPPVRAEDMYRTEISGRSASGTVQVVEPGRSS